MMKSVVRILTVATLFAALLGTSLAQSDLSCSFAPFLPDPYRELVQEAFDLIFFEACERHDECYGTCLASTPLGYTLHKKGCDSEFLIQASLACEAESILATVAQGGKSPSEYTLAYTRLQRSDCGDLRRLADLIGRAGLRQ